LASDYDYADYDPDDGGGYYDETADAQAASREVLAQEQAGHDAAAAIEQMKNDGRFRRIGDADNILAGFAGKLEAARTEALADGFTVDIAEGLSSNPELLEQMARCGRRGALRGARRPCSPADPPRPKARPMTRRTWIVWTDDRDPSPIEQGSNGCIELPLIGSEIAEIRLEPPEGVLVAPVVRPPRMSET
jgi:hypothetical protein